MKTEHLKLIKLVFCGPCDVAKEIIIGNEVVEQWNQRHGEARGLWVKHHNWETDIYPDLSDRSQSVVNRQIIDESRILIAVFWSRFGTPTGVASSGTQEEILRAANMGRKVMVYFSDLEPLPKEAKTEQINLLWAFRQSLKMRGLCQKFSSRSEFRRLLENHLALVLNSFEPKPQTPAPTPKHRPNVKQKAKTARGNIYQNVGDTYHYARPPVEKIIRERRPGSVTTEEVFQINEWIKELAEREVDKTRKRAFQFWGGRFKTQFRLGHREDLPSAKMKDANVWFELQKILQKDGLKKKAPELYHAELIKSIKQAMNQMGKTNENYYPDLSIRLKMKKPFRSLTDLTGLNLGRVYRMVRADARKTSK